MINEVLERNRNGNSNTNNSDTYETNHHSNITVELMIPGSKCGLIIGKNGETIKSMQVNFKQINFYFFL